MNFYNEIFPMYSLDFYFVQTRRLVVGYHPLLVCKEQEHTILDIKVSESLHQIFLQYRVNAYLSKQGCSGRYIRDEGIAYIGNPDPTDKSHIDPLENGTSSFLKGMLNDGFLLHRVSPLEIVSYFIDSASKVIFKSSLHQRGREVMWILSSSSHSSLFPFLVS